jgi:diketogulonate reductase-like aldo/keto reductase
MPSNPLWEQVRISCQKSLANLHTTYLNSYLLQSPLTTMHETREAWGALMQLQDEGTVRMIGVSPIYEMSFLQIFSKRRKV